MYKSELSQSYESGVQPADYSNACSKLKAFNYHVSWKLNVSIVTE